MSSPRGNFKRNELITININFGVSSKVQVNYSEEWPDSSNFLSTE
jgi:hypothetical protein